MTTLNIYTHSFANANTVASTIMENVLANCISPPPDNATLN